MRRRGRSAAVTILGAATLAALAGCGGGPKAGQAKGQTLSVKLTNAGCAPAGLKASRARSRSSCRTAAPTRSASSS